MRRDFVAVVLHPLPIVAPFLPTHVDVPQQASAETTLIDEDILPVNVLSLFAIRTKEFALLDNGYIEKIAVYDAPKVEIGIRVNLCEGTFQMRTANEARKGIDNVLQLSC
jgi:hypothetical protein